MKVVVVSLCITFMPLVAYCDNKIVLTQSEGNITFVVDKNLKCLKEEFYLQNGVKLAKTIVSAESDNDERSRIIATSFAKDRHLLSFGQDAFFQSILWAYANHLSVTLSPDMIWLLISQGLSRYVNANPEKLRPLIVDHNGKVELEVESEIDLFSGNTNWSEIFNEMASKISKSTKDDIVKTITSDFSTSTESERIASQVTLMEILKSYFDYTVIYVACGIPSITIKGTPQDWIALLEKTRKLEKYELGHWTKSLEPLIYEFIQASEGRPNQKFWKNMVKKKRVKALKGNNCGPKAPTELDGWLLRFFPDEYGNTRNKIAITESLSSELLRVGFTYRKVDQTRSMILSESSMELWAGFVGAEIDTNTKKLTPKIGWLVISND